MPTKRQRLPRLQVDRRVDAFQLQFHEWPRWYNSIDGDVPQPIPEKFLGHEWSPRDRYGKPLVMTQTRDEMTLEYRAEGIVMGWRLAALEDRSYPKDQAEYALIEEFKRWVASLDRSKSHPLPSRYAGYRWSPLNSFGEWLTVLPSLEEEKADRITAVGVALAEIRGDVQIMLADVKVD